MGRAAATPTRRPQRDPARVGGAAPPPDETALGVALESSATNPNATSGSTNWQAAAGLGQFRLLRLVRERTGLPPTRCSIAHRLRKARRLLEAGRSVAETTPPPASPTKATSTAISGAASG